MKVLQTGTLLFVVLAIVGGLNAQGDLSPPSGPPGPVMKSLDEVEPRIQISEAPFTITESGSYYFTQNVTGSEGQNGITIAEGVDNVTIDLMGYSLQGVEGSLHGIASADRWGTNDNVSIRNGGISGFAGDGIELAYFGRGRIIEEMVISENGGHGIGWLRQGVVRSCIISGNGGSGIRLQSSVVVETCTIADNRSTGVFGGTGNLIVNCIVTDNGSGISLGVENQVIDCVSRGNGNGIRVSTGSRVSGSTASDNDAYGILVSGPGGIPGTPPHGQRAVVVDSIADGNRGAGIAVRRIAARVESNHVSRNEVGIKAESMRNLIVRNSAVGNTDANYEIVEGNEVGPIGTMAEVGEHPWANFSIGVPEEEQ